MPHSILALFLIFRPQRPVCNWTFFSPQVTLTPLTPNHSPRQDESDRWDRVLQLLGEGALKFTFLSSVSAQPSLGGDSVSLVKGPSKNSRRTVCRRGRMGGTIPSLWVCPTFEHCDITLSSTKSTL